MTSLKKYYLKFCCFSPAWYFLHYYLGGSYEDIFLYNKQLFLWFFSCTDSFSISSHLLFLFSLPFLSFSYIIGSNECFIFYFSSNSNIITIYFYSSFKTISTCFPHLPPLLLSWLWREPANVRKAVKANLEDQLFSNLITPWQNNNNNNRIK